MRQEFFENTSESRFILSLLYNTCLPVMDSISKGDVVIEDTIYATRGSIVRCTESGLYGIDGKVEKIRDYNFGYYYPKFTERFIPKNQYYDSDTHKWLGKYLRAYSDYYGINLMPYYNVFSGEYISTITIYKAKTTDDTSQIKLLSPSGKKTLRIPIQFNKTYTIAIDSPSQVFMSPCFLMKDYTLTTKDPVTKQETDITAKFISDHLELGIDLITEYPNLSFSNPISYRLDCYDKDYVKYEDNLYLLIQLNDSVLSSFVVLEGDYTNYYYKENIISVDQLDNKIDSKALDTICLSNLSLLQFSDGKSYPYAHRLIEYLLNNVISSLDMIGKDFARIQDNMPLLKADKYVYGAWNDYIRYYVYKLAMTNTKIRHVDIYGYVDKDSETVLR